MLKKFTSRPKTEDVHVDDFWGHKKEDNDEDPSSSSEEEEKDAIDLNDMIEELEKEIDAQENISKTFRKIVADKMHAFEKNYEPTEEEKEEVKEVAKEFPELFPKDQQRIAAKVSNIAQNASNVAQMRKPSRREPHTELAQAVLNLKPATSVIVRNVVGRGGKTVLIQKGKVKQLCGMVVEKEETVKLIVFSNAFLVEKKSIIGTKSVAACALLYDVDTLVDLSISKYKGKHSSSLLKESSEDNDYANETVSKYYENGFRIIMDDNSSYSFVCSSESLKMAWIDLLSIAIMTSKRRTEYFRDNEEFECMGNEKEYSIMRTTLFSAATIGDEIMVDRILKRGEFHVDTPDFKGYTALHYATAKDNISCMKLLIDAGADVNRKSLNMTSPGAHAKSQRALEMLAASGANADDFPETILREAIKIDIEDANENAMSGLRAMQERAEKLKAIDKKSADIVQEAKSFKEMAHELKERQNAQANWSLLSSVMNVSKKS